jgi:hypothetical protein
MFNGAYIVIVSPYFRVVQDTRDALCGENAKLSSLHFVVCGKHWAVTSKDPALVVINITMETLKI